jgi:hypothetical protein
MKKLNKKGFNMDMYDSATGRSIKPLLVLDASDECPPSKGQFLLLYAKAVRGPLVQLRHGGCRIHYFLNEIEREGPSSALNNWAIWTKLTRAQLVQLCLKHSPFTPTPAPR